MKKLKTSVMIQQLMIHSSVPFEVTHGYVTCSDKKKKKLCKRKVISVIPEGIFRACVQLSCLIIMEEHIEMESHQPSE